MSPSASGSRFAGEILTRSDSHVSGSVKAGKYTLPDFTVVQENAAWIRRLVCEEGSTLYPFSVSFRSCDGDFSRVPRPVPRPISRWELDHEEIDDCTRERIRLISTGSVCRSRLLEHGDCIIVMKLRYYNCVITV